jgi:hypothetical protein
VAFFVLLPSILFPHLQIVDDPNLVDQQSPYMTDITALQKLIATTDESCF